MAIVIAENYVILRGGDPSHVELQIIVGKDGRVLFTNLDQGHIELEIIVGKDGRVLFTNLDQGHIELEIIVGKDGRVLFTDGDSTNVDLKTVPAKGVKAILVPKMVHRHKIAGVVKVDGLPAKRCIFALNRATFAYIGATVSDPVTGAWEMHGLPEYAERGLLIVAIDDAGSYNAEVADYVTQVATV